MTQSNSLRQGDWWRSAVIYQVYPRSYMDANGDGIGDIPGITQRLPYIAELGVDTVWLSPFFKSPMKDYGYDVSDYCDVDPIFGTLDDFDAMVARAHGLGLRIMIDQVLSHTSDQHPWFEESRQNRDNPKADWYVWADPKDDGSVPNNWQSVFGGTSWQWDSRRRQYYMHNFLVEQPDLNFHNPDVQDMMLQTVQFWIDRGVDGFRLDTANFYAHNPSLKDNPPHPDSLKKPVHERSYVPYDHQLHLHDKSQPENIRFMERLRALCEPHNIALLGEIGDDDQFGRMKEYTAGNDRLHTAYSFGFLGKDKDAAFVRQALAPFVGSDSWPSWSLGNHDCHRLATRWAEPGEDIATQQALQCYAVLLLTMLGTPCIYQGEELGLPEAKLAFHELVDPPGITFWPEPRGRDGCRTPMPWSSSAADAGFGSESPWLPVRDTHRERAVDVQLVQSDSLLAFYQQLLAVRKAHPALGNGGFEWKDCASGDALHFLRTGEGGDIAVVINLGEQPLPLPKIQGQLVLGSAEKILSKYEFSVFAIG
ncbi:MAG: DUF3459 domain-containing protein [Gammaproteobacteria bacterium]|nr:DUF3459 domain-containing protein [Gammaproteobacteria bacterium]